jgi:NADH-quinone oxidoreductase subunit H
LRYPPHRPFLVILGLILVGCGLLFAIPAVNAATIGVFWFIFKIAIAFYLLILLRGTFPRFRYDQLMNIGWKIMIPVALASIGINAVLGMLGS